jgi:hypothetical protein
MKCRRPTSIFASFIKTSIFVVAVSSVAASGALSQSATATLGGTVVDASGAVVADVNLTLVNDATGLQRQAKTNGEGYFIFPLTSPGRYTVKARREGFATAELTNLVLNVDDHVGIKVKLKVGQINQTIDVADELATRNESASVSTVIDRQFASELPLNGRSFDSLIRLIPGTAVTVAQSWEPGQFSFNGQRPNANYFMVDGVGANVGISATTYLEQTGAGTAPPVSALGGTNSLVPVDALQEFRVETSSYAAEFGRTAGAQVSLITRSGGKAFHGTAFYYLRNDALDANDWFANRAGLAKAPLRQNDFGGVLGGPIVRNHTFFFATYEGLRLRLPHVSTLTPVPSVSLRQNAPSSVQPLLNAFPVPNGRDLGNGLAEFSASFSNPSTVDATSIRIDHAVNGRLSLFGRYNHSPSDATYRGGLGAALSMPTILSNRLMTLTLGATKVFGPRVANDFRFNYSRVESGGAYPLDDFGGATPPPPSTLFPSFVNPSDALFNFRFLKITGWMLGPVAENRQRQLNIVNNLSAIVGNHAFRFGADYRGLFPISEIPQYTLTEDFDTTDDILSGRASSVSVMASKGRLYPIFKNFSAYIQDAWTIGRRLTITYGLRWELNPPPGEANGNTPFTVLGLENPSTMTLAPKGTPFYKTTYSNFAPRIGVAYHLLEATSRQTVLRGGFGVFYDLGSGTASSAFYAAGFPNSSTKTLYNAQFPLSSDDLTPIPFSESPPYPLLIVTDRNLSLPRTYHWNTAVERSLDGNQSLSFSYIGAAGRRLLRREYLSKPNSNFLMGVEVTRNTAFSDYHSLQIQFQRRLSRGLQAFASYAWAHSTDNDSFESITLRPVTTTDSRRDHSSSDFDIRHLFSAAVTYSIPNPITTNLLSRLFQSWSVDAVVRMNTALPVNVVAVNSLATRPDLIAGVPLYVDDPTSAGGRRINQTAFSSSLSDQQGTLGRNALRGFPVSQTDIALQREFRLMEPLNLQFRLEAFNVFNHPNFAQPVPNIKNPQFGRSTKMLNQSLGFDAGLNPLYQIGGPRSIQLSMKLHF